MKSRKKILVSLCLISLLIGSSVRSQELDGHFTGVRFMQFSADGSKLISHSEDKTIIFWDVKEAKQTKTLRIRGLFSVLPAADGNSFLLSKPHAEVLTWDGATSASAFPNTLGILRFLDQGSYISLDRSTMLLSITSGSKLSENKIKMDRDGDAYCVSSDRKLIAIPTRQKTTLYSIPDLKSIREFPGKLSRSCAFSPDGKTIAIGEIDVVFLWKLDGKEPEKKMGVDPQYGGVNYFSLDGKTLVLISGDHATFWQLEKTNHTLFD